MRSIVDVLVGQGKLTPEHRNRVQKLQETSAEPLQVLLETLGLASSGDCVAALADLHDVPIAAPGEFPPELPLADLLPQRFLRDRKVLPLAAGEAGVVLAMADPGDEYALRAVALATGRRVEPRVAAAEHLEEAFARYFERGRSAMDRIIDDIKVETDGIADADIEHLKDLAQEAPVIRLVNQIIMDAIRVHASDIHLEVYREELKVRYRIHGILREMTAPPARLAPALVSRVKILSRLDIAERRLPQDGRARFSVGGRSMDMRIATMPTMHGENVVIRLLDHQGMALDLTELGLDRAVEGRLRRHLAHPHGIILVTGPTGSGKTTTLYAALRLLNTPARKILTVEDPIEYQIEGINQIHVRTQIGLDFARVLRSCMRHDPDVIMVGEIRDRETAEIAVHAALTGHLVLSTLHTNNAAGSINRLLDMGVDGYLLTSTIKGVVGQRLVRQLCLECRSPYPAPPELLAQMATAPDPALGPPTFYRAIGCPACEGIGYTSRLGIFEYLELDDRLRELLHDRIATAELATAAQRAGMVTMYQDGLRKCLAGITSVEEVLRVTEES